MCGIFGLYVGEQCDLDDSQYSGLVNRLFKLSESRGKEAAGVAFSDDNAIKIIKGAIPASKMIKTQKFRQTLTQFFEQRQASHALGLIGHSRLVTNGLQAIESNNQPFVRHGMTCVHNGIVVNVDPLWEELGLEKRTAQVDTEIILSLIEHFRHQGSDIATAISQCYQKIYGETSIAVLFAELDVLALATNTGSLHYLYDEKTQFLTFASENKIIEKVINDYPQYKGLPIKQLKPNEILLLNTGSFALTHSKMNNVEIFNIGKRENQRKVVDSWQETQTKRENLRRCSKCILPETIPNISFDSAGVCNFCNQYNLIKLQGPDALEQKLAKYRKNNGEPDCIVAFSGGRDSSYGLHLLKNEFNMTPLVFSYDWGLITDLARRNQSRICGALGVEHIWISADIQKKRKNVRRNVNAWLSRPDLGTIPLFMAGDKQYMYHANQLMKTYNIDLMVLCENALEQTNFKSGFAGVNNSHKNTSVYKLSKFNKVKMLSYYMKQVLLNMRYLNRSVIDTMFAFFSYYMIKQDFLILFDYLEWNEDKINDVLINQYDWEVAKDTPSTWRIGDGTAPFYNYIYYTVAGFTEFDTFRSNQIRENILTREQALDFVREENKPRWDSMKEYTEIIGVDFDHAVTTINNIPKLYA